MYGCNTEFEDNGKHIYTTLKIFRRWSRIGFIGGQQKEKYGSIRWYADTGPINDLHNIFKVGHVAYRWDPMEHPVKDFINNLSKYFFRLEQMVWLTSKYQILIYNVAYRHALLASPGYETEILGSCDHSKIIWGYKKLKAKYGDGWSDGNI